MKTNLKNKLKNTKFDFSGNFLKSLVVPVLFIVLAIVFAFTIQFNKGMELKGGIIVTVVADTQTDLSNSETYKEFKSRVDTVLKDNKVNGNTYQVEVNEYQEYTMVVKFTFSGNDDVKTEKIADIKEDMIAEFYSTTAEEDIDLNQLIIVSTFGGAMSQEPVLYSILASLISAIIMCVYLIFRANLATSVIAVVLAVFNNMFVWSMIMALRVQLSWVTLAVTPFVTILSILATFIFSKKAIELFKSTDKYEKQSNNTLTNDTMKSLLYSIVLLSGFSILGLIVIGSLNTDIVRSFSLALVLGVFGISYSTIMLLPRIYAMLFIRKIKKQKVKKTEESKKLKEEEVLKETDLNEIVSN